MSNRSVKLKGNYEKKEIWEIIRDEKDGQPDKMSLRADVHCHKKIGMSFVTWPREQHIKWNIFKRCHLQKIFTKSQLSILNASGETYVFLHTDKHTDGRTNGHTDRYFV